MPQIIFVTNPNTDPQRLTGNPTLSTLDGVARMSLNSVKLLPPEDRESVYGVYEVTIYPPEGQQWTGTFDGMTPVYEDIPPPPVPSIVSMRKARLALHGAGLLPQIESAIAALEEPQKTQVSIEWEYAQDVNRDHPWVQTLTAQLGLTAQQLDDLFAAAAALSD